MRYAIEFLAPLYPRRRVRSTLRAASELVELLGAMNDIAVARAITADIPQGPDDDLLAAWLGARRAAQRTVAGGAGGFPARYAALARRVGFQACATAGPGNRGRAVR